MNYCQYIFGAHGDPQHGRVNDYCDEPASIKHNGRWVCAEHYDEMARNAVDDGDVYALD